MVLKNNNKINETFEIVINNGQSEYMSLEDFYNNLRSRALRTEGIEQCILHVSFIDNLFSECIYKLDFNYHTRVYIYPGRPTTTTITMDTKDRYPIGLSIVTNDKEKENYSPSGKLLVTIST